MLMESPAPRHTSPVGPGRVLQIVIRDAQREWRVAEVAKAVVVRNLLIGSYSSMGIVHFRNPGSRSPMGVFNVEGNHYSESGGSGHTHQH